MKLNWKLFAPLVVAILVWLIQLLLKVLAQILGFYVSIFAGLVVELDFRTNATSFYRYHCCYHCLCLRLVLPW